MSESKFVYTIFIRATTEQVWDGLTKPESTRRFWCEVTMESDWKKGSEWVMLTPDGRIADSGEVLEVDHPKRLLLAWRHQLLPDLRAEGTTQALLQLEQIGDCVKLTITHKIGRENSKLIAGFADGWPPLLSSLKSLLETGEPLAMTTKWPAGM
jgi:uncharacterized protein YndB with AHSA1/START domain